MIDFSQLVMRFDDLKDDDYPNGAWFVTFDCPDDPFGCDKWYGNTPNEALEAFIKDNGEEK